MNYLSVCAGIEAATQAWHRLGWKPVAFSEIDKFPAAVLAHHYPNVPNWGDMTKFQEWPHADVDVLVGGTPCQSFSVAGLRAGLADPRGNLALTYLAIAQRYRPEWLVWENVPGVLSADGGRAFGAIIGGMVELGYCPAWRVLDAQYIRTRRYPHAVPQRRRRVFVVAHLGDWRRAAAVLFDRESLSGNPPPGREAGQAITHDASPCIGASGRGFERSGETRGQDRVVAHFQDSEFGCKEYDTAAIRAGRIPEHSMILNSAAHALTRRYDSSEDGCGRGTPLVPCLSSGQANAELCDNLSPALNCNRDGAPIVGQPVAFSSNMSNPDYQTDGSTPAVKCGGHGGGNPPAVAFPINTQMALRGAETSNTSREGVGLGVDGDPAFTLQAGHHHAVAFGFKRGQGEKAGSLGYEKEVAPTLTGVESGTQNPPGIHAGMAVRRLTPVECERLQGFPDNFTRIPWRGKPADQCPDGPRYKALGNSMATNVMELLGERIQRVAK